MNESWLLKVFYDGACPLCRREIDWIRQKTGEGTVCYIDTASPDFESRSEYQFYQHDTDLMQALLPGNQKIYGVEVFRQLYKQAGLGWLLAPTAWPILKPCFDLAYRIFAKYRKQLPGRHCDEQTCS